MNNELDEDGEPLLGDEIMRLEGLPRITTDEWHSVIDCSCRISELAMDSVPMELEYSYLTEFVRRREREMPPDTFDLEAVLAQSD